MKTSLRLKNIRSSALICLLLGFTLALKAQMGSIAGTAWDSKEKISYASSATITAIKDGAIIQRVMADLDGQYKLSLLPPGTYSVEIDYLGQKSKVEGIVVTTGESVKNDMIAGIIVVPGGVIHGEKVFSVDPENPIEMDKKGLKESGIRDPASAMAAISSEVYTPDQGKPLLITGARSSGTEYIVDGQKIRGDFGMPAGSIDQVMMISGGTPAEYGDATGGVIIITTRSGMKGYTGPLHPNRVKKEKPRKNSINGTDCGREDIG